MSNYWILLQSVYGKELQAESDLVSAGYQVYLPRKRTDLRTRRKTKVIVEALFPSYLFCYVIEGETDIHPIKHIAHIVHFGGDVARASEAIISGLRAREDAQGVHETKFQFETDDKVSLRSGQWQGYEAIISKLDKKDRALIRFLETGKMVEVPISDLKPAA